MTLPDPLKLVLIGLGNVNRRDDGIGIYACQKFMKNIPVKFQSKIIIFLENDPIFDLDTIVLELLDCSNKLLIVFIDAAHLGTYTGELMWIKNVDELEPIFGTHEIALPLYMKMLQNKGHEVLLLAIRYENTSFGTGLSENMKEFLDKHFLKDDKLSNLISQIKSDLPITVRNLFDNLSY